MLQQPFRHIDPIAVSLAPLLELRRGGIGFGCEPQFADHQFELGQKTWSGRCGMPPVGVAALVRRRHRSDTCHHRTQSYAALCVWSLNSQHPATG